MEDGEEPSIVSAAAVLGVTYYQGLKTCPTLGGSPAKAGSTSLGFASLSLCPPLSGAQFKGFSHIF